MISVIIPIYNEESVLSDNADYFDKLTEHAEVIFVDGGSTDRSEECAERFDGGRLVRSAKGRAVQMNRGAEVAQQSILLFLHADTRINPSTLKRIEEYVKRDGYVGGCFHQSIDGGGLLYKWIAFTGNIRAKLTKVFYGDQGIFVRKDVFTNMGGFPIADIGEDVAFSKKLRRSGPVSIFKDPIYCSDRRWAQQGVVKTYLINSRVKFGLLFGQNKKNLANTYRDIR